MTVCSNAARYGQLDCLKYLVEEAKVPLNSWDTSLTLVTTSTPSAKTTCSKKGAQNQRTKNTRKPAFCGHPQEAKPIIQHHNDRLKEGKSSSPAS